MGRPRVSKDKIAMNIACITPILHLDETMNILNSFADVYYIPYVTKEELIFQLTRPYATKRYTGIYTNPNEQGFVIDRDILDLGIEVVCTASTGTNHIDMAYCKEKGIEVISLTTDYETIEKISATAEHAFTLTTSLIRKIPQAVKASKEYNWHYEEFIGRQLRDLKFGVVGFGRLGKMYHKYASAFSEHEVMICDPYKPEHTASLQEVFSECDVVSLHVHLNEETKEFINYDLFKKPLYLINTSRGGVVSEVDVVGAIRDGKLLGYATDVIQDELGDVKDSIVIEYAKKFDNILVTPHIAGMTRESQNMAYERVANKLKEYAENKND